MLCIRFASRRGVVGSTSFLDLCFCSIYASGHYQFGSFVCENMRIRGQYNLAKCVDKYMFS